MKSSVSRRSLMKAAGAGAIALAPGAGTGTAAMDHSWPIEEGPNTPKLCMPPPGRDEAAYRKVKQIGVNYILGGGPSRIPWTEEEMRARVEAAKAAGLTLYNQMIGGFNNAIYNRPGRDEDIEKVKESIRVAGKVGIAVVEYNWYAHRAMEGYYEETGRAGAGYTAFDYERMKNLPPLPEEGAHTLDEMWTNITYFLKAVVPVAEQSNVRLALHPNDPPAPLSRGSQQIMGSLAGWKKLADIVKSPANGITFDCGVTREMGENPVEVAAYFASRKQINHVHYRNVQVRKPHESYTEVFIDAGMVNMFAVMRELIKQKYTGSIYPEHARALDYDRERGPIRGYPGGGGYTGDVYDVAYARAMMQAALSV